MKRLISIIIVALALLGASAQGQQQQPERRFSPEQFENDMKEYITKEASLTPQEAAKFFPVFKEMNEKQRVLFDRQRRLNNVKPSDEQGCLKAIREADELDVELKKVQQTYHSRFLELLPASKVYDILKAEQRFYRRMMRGWGRGNNQGGFGGGQRQGFGQRHGFSPFGTRPGAWPQQPSQQP